MTRLSTGAYPGEAKPERQGQVPSVAQALCGLGFLTPPAVVWPAGSNCIY